MTAITYLQTMPWRALGWRWRRVADTARPKGYRGRHRSRTAHEGATTAWSPVQEQAAFEPQLPDVEMVKGSEDALIIHNILNEITGQFRTQLDAVCKAWTDRICEGDATLIHRALVCAEPTGQYELADLTALLAETALAA